MHQSSEKLKKLIRFSHSLLFFSTAPLHYISNKLFLLYIISGEYVAQFKHTVLLMPNGVNLVTGIPFEIDNFVSEYSIAQPELKVMIDLGLVKNIVKHNLCVFFIRNLLLLLWDPLKRVRDMLRKRLPLLVQMLPLLRHRLLWRPRLESILSILPFLLWEHLDNWSNTFKYGYSLIENFATVILIFCPSSTGDRLLTTFPPPAPQQLYDYVYCYQHTSNVNNVLY